MLERIVHRIFLPLALCAVASQVMAQRELGDVEWLRNYEAAQEAAQKTGKPLLILFQEVPGCHGCVQYGQETLRHPLIVDAIENEFIPLAIHNNAFSGHDRKILKQFGEPSWNFQVMRFIDQNGQDIIPRKDRVWTIEGTAQRMIHALESAQKAVPEYLRTIKGIHKASVSREAAFSMYCFWDGEAKLGGIHGVIETEAGWLDGREVVRVRYDASQIEWAELVQKANSHNCANQIYAPDEETLAQTPASLVSRAKVFTQDAYRIAKKSDQKRHLRFSKIAGLPLNKIQKTKINAALSERDPDSVGKWLSPSQLQELL